MFNTSFLWVITNIWVFIFRLIRIFCTKICSYGGFTWVIVRAIDIFSRIYEIDCVKNLWDLLCVPQVVMDSKIGLNYSSFPLWIQVEVSHHMVWLMDIFWIAIDSHQTPSSNWFCWHHKHPSILAPIDLPPPFLWSHSLHCPSQSLPVTKEHDSVHTDIHTYNTFPWECWIRA